MTRNFDRRIELLFNIDDPDLKEHLQWILQTYWKDNTKSRIMDCEGAYTYLNNDEEPFNAQEFFIDYYS
jgi:polyphosphate kinase